MIALVAAAIGIILFIPKIRGKVVPAVKKAASDIWTVIRNPKKALQLLGGDLAGNLIYPAILGICLLAFHQRLDYAELVCVQIGAGMLGNVAPVPGGIGVQEAALTAGLTSFGIPAAPALATVLVFRGDHVRDPAVLRLLHARAGCGPRATRSRGGDRLRGGRRRRPRLRPPRAARRRSRARRPRTPGSARSRPTIAPSSSGERDPPAASSSRYRGTKSSPCCSYAAVHRQREQLPVRVRVHVAGRAHEVRDVRPPGAVALGDLDRVAEHRGLRVGPRLVELLDRQLALVAPLRVHAVLEAVHRDLAEHRGDLAFEALGEQREAAPRDRRWRRAAGRR